MIYGLVAGVLAKTVFPGRDPGGLLVTSLLGILGSVTGGWVFNLFGWSYQKGFSLKGILPAFVGALVILTFFKLITRFFKRRSR